MPLARGRSFDFLNFDVFYMYVKCFIVEAMSSDEFGV